MTMGWLMGKKERRKQKKGEGESGIHVSLIQQKWFYHPISTMEKGAWWHFRVSLMSLLSKQ